MVSAVELYRENSRASIRAWAVERGLPLGLVHWRDKREEGRCRMCLRPASVRPLTRHHVVPVSWFFCHHDRELMVLRNCAPNVVPLCRPCHDEVEKGGVARRMLRKVMSPDEYAFAHAVAGRRWFDRRY